MTEPQSQPQSPVGEPRDSRQVAAPPQQQPEYGVRIEPEYGARADELPQGYDPYLYGRPDDDARNNGDAQNSQSQNVGFQQQDGWAQGDAGEQGQNQPAQSPYNSRNGDGPHYYHGINLDDPQQNPIYGHWDFYAIFAFVFSILFSMPVLPSLIAGIAIWRMRRFHTKGFGLAVAAIIINILTTIMVVWLMMHGISADEFYRMMMDMIQSPSGGSGSWDGTVSA